MLKDQPQNPFSGHCFEYHLFCLAVLIAEGHVSVFTAYNIFFPNDATIQITAQVNQRLFAGTDRLAINNPFFWISQYAASQGCNTSCKLPHLFSYAHGWVRNFKYPVMFEAAKKSLNHSIIPTGSNIPHARSYTIAVALAGIL